jgi:hypothetical protein
MSSLDLDTPARQRSRTDGVAALLDAAFGLLVWAAHFLVIYIATAVACVLNLRDASGGARTAFLTTLIIVTLAACALVVLHALRRYRQQHELPEQRFRLALTIGCDAIATLAMAWQLFPILLVPLCA